MLRNFFSPYFWVTLVALTLASGLFWLGSFRHVEGTVSLLMLAKSDTAIVAPGNAKQLLLSTSFQKALTPRFNLLDAPFEQDIFKHRAWDEMIQAKVLPESSVLVVTTSTETDREGKFLLDALVKELMHTLSQFYNFETELDVRIIDGPRFTTGVSTWPRFLAASLGSGFLITSLFFLFLSALEHLTTKRHFEEKQRAVYHISPETFRPQAVAPYWSREETLASPVPPEETVEPEYPKEETVYPYAESFSDPNPAEVIEALPDEPEAESLYQEESVSQAESGETLSEAIQERAVPHGYATGPAPDNLPIADLSPLEEANARLLKADIDAVAEVQSEAAEQTLVATLPETLVTTEPRTGEPTQEEYKRRLNELLSGRL